jgi:hypothetical protein
MQMWTFAYVSNSTYLVKVQPSVLAFQSATLLCVSGDENADVRCNATWRIFHNVAVTNGITFYALYTTVDTCLLACVNKLPGCVAAQVRNTSDSFKCFLLTEANSLRSMNTAAGVNVYALTLTCGSGT